MSAARALILAALGLCAIFPAAAVVTTPGALDNTFGVNAIATVPATTSFDVAYGAAGTGAQYVTGVAYRGNTPRLFVAKFQPDGTLDPTFGTAGRVMPRLDFPSEGTTVREDSDGRVVVAGTHHLPTGDQWIVIRFYLDGTLDTAFGLGGLATGKVFGSTTGAALSIQADGKILVAGTGYTSNLTLDMTVFRLNANGSPDIFFGTNGAITLDFRGGHDYFRFHDFRRHFGGGCYFDERGGRRRFCD